MKKYIFFFLFGLSSGISFAQSGPGKSSDECLNSYSHFLNDQHVPAKEYIFDLFEKYNIIVLCERDHRDMSQYDLFFDIVSDERFQGGNMLMEVGASNVYDSLDYFLHHEFPSEEEAEARLLYILHNNDHYPLWEKTNYPTFLKKLYNHNRTLPREKQVNVFPVDVPFDWNEIDSKREHEEFLARYARFPERDSIMGTQMVERISSVKKEAGNRQKFLILMNDYHALFNLKAAAAAYVKRAFPEETVNVLVSGPVWNKKRYLIDEGCWDAAFRMTDKENLGFDLANSPFGETSGVHYHSRFRENIPMKNIFHGYVFYLPVEDHLLSQGYPNMVSGDFKKEMRRRNRILLGRFKAIFVGAQKNYYNRVKTWKYGNLDELIEERDRWIE